MPKIFDTVLSGMGNANNYKMAENKFAHKLALKDTPQFTTKGKRPKGVGDL